MSNFELGDDLAGAVAETSRRLRRNTLVAGSAWVKAVVIGWLVLGIAVDLVAPLSVPMRVATFMGFWLLLVAMLGLAVVWPTLRRPRMQQVAMRIERAVGGMHNRLVTLLDLRRRNGSAGGATSGYMVERLVEQTRQKMAGYRVEAVADPRPMRRGLIAAAGVLLVLAAMALLGSSSFPTALSRLVRPTADIPPATWLRLEAPGDQRVLRGEPITVEGKVLRGTTNTMTLRMRSATMADAAWIDYPMRSSKAGVFVFEVPAVNEDYEYKLVAGRTWTRSFRITAVPRPVVEELGATVNLPAYMGLPEPLVVDREAPQALVPVGSTVWVSAKVSGAPILGDLRVLRPRLVESQKTVEEETVWFEDDPPPDAALYGRWTWSTENPHSGVRAHTFGWERAPYGFRTRLNPLNVPADGVLYTYIHLDPLEPPERVVVEVGSGDQVRYLVWGGPADDIEKAKPGTTRHLGALPPVGQWARLEAPVSTAFAPQGVKLSGMAFRIDKGRASFDRSGYLVRQSTTVQEEKLEAIDQWPMKLGEDGRWTAEVEVHDDVQLAVKFHNDRNDPSRDVKPIVVVATEDQPPTVVVEKPGKDVVLPELLALPLLVRAFDDWGLDAVGLEQGDAPERLSAPYWIDRPEKPEASRMVLGSVDPREKKLQPGQTLFYRLVARDRKGQESRSPIYKLTLASPQQPPTPELARKPGPLEGLKKGLEKLLEAVSNIAKVAEALVPELGKEREKPLTPEEVSRLADEQARKLDAKGRQQLLQADQQVEGVQRSLEQSAKQLERAAAESRESALSSPQEAQALRELAEKAAELAAELEPQMPSNPNDQAQKDRAMLERLIKAQQIADGKEAPLQDLARQLSEVDRARQETAQDPSEARRRLARVATELQAEQVAQTLEGFEGVLQEQREELGDLQKESAELARKMDEVDDDARPALEARREKLAEQSREELNEANKLIGRPTEQPAREDVPRALVESEQELDETVGQSQAVRERIDGLRDEMREKSTEDSRAGERLRELLSDEDTQRLLRLAERAEAAREMAQGEGEEDQMGQSGKDSKGRARRGKPGRLKPAVAASRSQPGTREVLILDGAALKADPADRATLYRLPPRIRDPLIQGMQEQGPEGYQPLIDAYYRQLSREVK